MRVITRSDSDFEPRISFGFRDSDLGLEPLESQISNFQISDKQRTKQQMNNTRTDQISLISVFHRWLINISSKTSPALLSTTRGVRTNGHCVAWGYFEKVPTRFRWTTKIH